MDLIKSMMISAAGMRAQNTRMRIIAENLANAGSVASRPGEDPYRRKVVTFKNQLDRELGVPLVKVDRIRSDRSEFGKRFDPGNPVADAQGYVKLPNVRPLIESMDMRQAQRSYEANLNAIEASKQMLLRTIDLLNQ